MIRAVEKVRQRLLRATSALDRANVLYAVIGGNAVAAWVSRIDETAVRNTQDVDLLIRRNDMDLATAALTAAGFIRQETLGVEMFLEGPQAGVRDAVHVMFAGEKVKPDDAAPAPDVVESERAVDYQVLSLEALVRMKLTAFRDKDRTHIRDLLGVGLIDAAWLNRFPAELATRLQLILDTPNG
jgi:hypothetical protein